MIYRCWRCTRGLGIYRAPVAEEMVVACPRCKAKNVVRAGQQPTEPIDSVPVQA